MKHKLLFAAAAVALMAPTMAAAQDSGVYLRGQLGYGVFEDGELTAPENPDANSLIGDVAGGGDLAYSLGLGYDTGAGWRIEGDYTNLFSDFGTIGGLPATYAKLRTQNLMLNLIYDFEEFGRFEPYIGGGIGVSRGNLSAQASDLINPNAPIAGRPEFNLVRHPACVSGARADDIARACDIDDKDSALAWNLIFGLGYAITDNLHWDTNYKYIDVNDFNFDGVVRNVGQAGEFNTNPLSSELDDTAAHVLQTGFRYRFGASTPEVIAVTPPPPPRMFTCWDGTQVTDAALCPPEPAPEPQRFTCEGSGVVVTDLALCPPRTECPDGSIVYGPAEFCPTTSGVSATELCSQANRQEIIYYEFDRGQSAETRNTINRILDVGAFCQVDNIRVVGHTDTSGSAAYNLRLSQKRAQDAVNELIRQGIDRNVISAEGKGETEPFIQTGDGVREQLNRRTEVLITLSDVGIRDMSSGN